MDEELRNIESKLEQMTPVAMPDDMLARMEQAMERWQEFVPVEEKVVPFTAPSQEGTKKLPFFNAWASAAAVALVAAASFMVFDRAPSETNVIADGTATLTQQEQPQQNVPSSAIGKAIPASTAQFQTQVTNTSDGVITYDANGRPMRVMQLDFEDEVILRDRNGKLYKVKQPRVEYYAVPIEIH